jgi:hypothetical protein
MRAPLRPSRPSDFYRKKARATDGERSSLVEQDSMRPRQSLKRRATLDQNAASGSLRDARNECDGSRQNERTRRCCNQHSEAANEKTRDDGRRRKRPAKTRDASIACGMRHNTRCQPKDCDRDKRPSHEALGH